MLMLERPRKSNKLVDLKSENSRNLERRSARRARNKRYAQRRRGLAPRAGAQKATSDAFLRSSANDALRP
jgi:hypothetical protein